MQEAIKAGLKETGKDHPYRDALIPLMKESCDMAIEALELVTINTESDEIKVTNCNDKDTIYRQDAIDAAMRDVSDKRTHDFNAGATRAANRIKSLPPAQPERKKGRWVKHDTGHSIYYDCSLCGCIAPCTEVSDSFIWKLSTYCPDCGAKMGNGLRTVEVKK